MIRYIHHPESLPKLLRGLRKSGKKAEMAANKCEAIVNDIRQYGCQCEAVIGKRTRNGEQRIKNCVKYDLGGGYRLVTIRADCHLYISFVGTHDETDQWIERHRYDILTPDDPLYRCEERVSQSDPGQTDRYEEDNLNKSDDRYEEDLRERLDESQLKSIFQGLFSHPTSPSDRTGGYPPAAWKTGRTNSTQAGR